MTVTHNGKQYTVKRCALNNNEWRLTSLTNPREQVTLNRWQMHVAGLLAQVEGKKCGLTTAPPRLFASASRPA